MACEICEFDDAIPGNFARVVRKLGTSQTALIVRIFVSFDWKTFKGQLHISDINAVLKTELY